MAPLLPFLTEEIYQNLKTKEMPESIHLCDWPKVEENLIDLSLEEKMNKARKIVNLGLKERARLGLKVRQPLRELTVGELADGLESELKGLIKEELNVKGFRCDLKLKEKIKLDETITVELKEEGIIREIVRHLQGMRKEADLKPKDKISIYYFGEVYFNKILEKNKKFFFEETRTKDFYFKKVPKEKLTIEKEIEIEEKKLWLGIKTD